MSGSAILEVEPLGFPWVTYDPFLFCVHHADDYPRGNAALGPEASLAGRQLGQDFTVKDGWRMYHGEVVPGFPQHPHRGFETVTVVRRGLIDHSDSLGATARFGSGDVQWLTAGKGIVHSEMFPLVERERGNPLELFQIWLNLPATSKMVEPHFSMLWAERMPRKVLASAGGSTVELTVIAGACGGLEPLSAPPSSWASRPDSDVAIWTLRLGAGASFRLPAAQRGTNRTLYFFRGDSLTVAGERVPNYVGVRLRAEQEVLLEAPAGEVEVLLLQGRPIGEPVVQYGPFVMNTAEEVQQAFVDYQRTRFGGWPFDRDDPVHPREAGRFARHAGGRTEQPG